MRTLIFVALAIGLLLPASALALNIAIHAGNNQTAPTGFSVPIDPAVRVTDSFGLPVTGETVTFAIHSGGGLISGAVQTTNAQGVATIGSWALGIQPGVKELRATLDGATGSPVIFTAVAEGSTDVQVSLELDGPITAGEPFLYQLSITNGGPYPANGVEVTMDYDPIIVPGSRAWLCTPGTGTSSCGENGVGPLFDYADLPPQGEVIYTIASAVPINLLDGNVTSTASIALPVGLLLTDPEAGEDSATGEINPSPHPIFSDRFEGPSVD